MFAGKKSAQIREILISESAWEEMTCLFAPSLGFCKETVRHCIQDCYVPNKEVEVTNSYSKAITYRKNAFETCKIIYLIAIYVMA